MTNNMKPTSIEWIGDIPSDWVIKKVKYLATLKGRIGWQGLTSDEYTDEGAYLITGTDFANGGINWITCVHVSMERWKQAKDIQIENGDLLITKDGTVGKVAVVDGLNGSASLNSGVLRILTFTGFEKKFLYWVLKSDVFWTWFTYKNAGNSTIIHLYQDDFAEFNYPIPPPDEQQTIAGFLDTQCGKVDSIIAELEQQIEILKQYKTSLITETVTKGLKKNVPMKDSGIDWIGRIPEHWEARKLKYVTKLRNENGKFYNDAVYLGLENVEGSTGKFIKTETEYNEGFYDIIKRDDVLFGKLRPYLEKVFMSKFDGFCSGEFLVFKEFEGEKRYLFYFLSSYGFIETVNSSTFGAKMPRAEWDYIKNLGISISTVEEQKTIASFLDKKCEEIMSIIEEKQLSIDTMKAYKKSLIYEYVTGKKRV
jgi:type I restriction enzyme S subunit/DNA-damage-inducible protein D